MAKSETKTAPQSSATKPVKQFRARGVHVSVFANPVTRGDQEGLLHKVSIQRVYKDGDEFKSTTGLGRDDLPIVRMLLSRAWEYIIDVESAKATDG